MADNLKKGNPDTQFKSGRKAAENGKKCGIASGKAKREKKAMKETVETLLSMQLKSGKAADVETIRNLAALKGKNVTVQEAIMLAQIQKAMKGDTRAAEYVRDTIGQKPDNKMNIDMNLPVFFEGEDFLED